MEPLWRIEMLGWLRVVPGDGLGQGETARELAQFRSRRSAMLLAYLAMAHSTSSRCSRSHPREVLIELLWPDASGSSGRTCLRTELSWLRQRLEPPGVPAGSVLVMDGDAVRLNPAACTTDVAGFEEALCRAAAAGTGAERSRWLAEAVKGYGGELLPGFFEAWVVPERLRLGEAFLDALEELEREREAAGDRAGALQWARRAAGADPLRERAAAEDEASCLAAHPAGRERSLRQQLHAQTAEVAKLRRQLSAQTEVAATLRRRLASERAETRRLQQELAARIAEAEAPVQQGK